MCMWGLCDGHLWTEIEIALINMGFCLSVIWLNGLFPVLIKKLKCPGI